METSRDRVMKAIDHIQPDTTPVNIMGFEGIERWLERFDVETYIVEQAAVAGVNAGREVGLPVRAEVEVGTAPNNGRGNHQPLDQFEAVNGQARWLGLSHGVIIIAPNAAAVCPRLGLQGQHVPADITQSP